MLNIESYTERGGDHSLNEDFFLRHRVRGEGERYLCFLADGQGGRPDGAIAAKTACEAGLEAALNRSWNDLKLGSTWDDIFETADQTVRKTCDGCTTLVGVAIDRFSITGASIGDSKVYFHDGESTFFELTNRQRKNPPVGGGCRSATPFCVPDFNGTILVATDGVWKYSGFEVLRDAACCGEIATISQSLREAVTSGSNRKLPDDFTVLVATNREP